jgi:cytochrome c oxidase assembly protein subunit 15
MLAAVIVFGLIIAGAQVTSNDAGLAVPTWPKGYGAWISPPLWLSIRNIFIEHFHRLYAFTVGLLALGLSAAVWRVEARRGVRIAALLLPVMVLCQGLLGGLRVLQFSKIWIAMLHGVFGQLTFTAFVIVAVMMTAAWRNAIGSTNAQGGKSPEPFITGLTAGLIFSQLILGAVMRHLRAGLAIPDFPLLRGALPAFTDSAVALAFAHRLLGVFVCGVLLLQAFRLRAAGARLNLISSSLAALGLMQIALGIFTVLSGRNPWLASLHTANGALLLAGQAALLLWLRRPAFRDDGLPATAASQVPSAAPPLRSAS